MLVGTFVYLLEKKLNASLKHVVNAIEFPVQVGQQIAKTAAILFKSEKFSLPNTYKIPSNTLSKNIFINQDSVLAAALSVRNVLAIVENLRQVLSGTPITTNDSSCQSPPMLSTKNTNEEKDNPMKNSNPLRKEKIREILFVLYLHTMVKTEL